MNFNRNATIRISSVIVVMLLATAVAAAQSGKETEVLIKEKKPLGFAVAFDTKLSRVNDKFATLVGFQAGLVVKPNFFIGLAGYGRPSGQSGEQMAYGGLVLENTFRPHKLFNYSIGGFLGAGSSDLNHKTFFAAEPRVTLFINITSWFRLGFSEGYRFIGNAGWANSRLRGPWTGINLAFCRR